MVKLTDGKTRLVITKGAYENCKSQYDELGFQVVEKKNKPQQNVEKENIKEKEVIKDKKENK